MPIRYAFVTLLTSDAYLPGALTIATALKDVHHLLPPDQTVEYETVCLVTPETVDVTTIKLLRRAFNVVVGVEVIVPPDADSLTLLGRPDLDTALTKLHVFRLTQYSKVIFLDADVLPLRPLSHLFHLDHEFSAVPDVGWPDIFNSGVMVLSPDNDKFNELRKLLNTKGTWDGADQGLLNEWRGDNWNRLSFTYNTTPTAIYTYAPAYQRFGSQISVLHFIGPQKPWHLIPDRAPDSSTQSTDMAVESSTGTPATQQQPYNYSSLVDRWHSVYDRHSPSQTTEPAFQPTRYTSAWNEEGHRRALVAGGALGLEELRRAALEGMGASGILAPRVHGEGEYRTMPLEGRFDLIRPRTRAEKKQVQVPKDSAETPESTLDPAERVQAQEQTDSTENPESTEVPAERKQVQQPSDGTETSESTQAPAEPLITTPEPSTPPGQILSLLSGSPARWTTLPTPGVHEIPPAPLARLISLPPTPLRYVPAPYKPRRNTREVGAQTVPTHSQQRESGRENLSTTPLMQNPTVETPPNVATPVPTDTYFPKIWDVDRDWSSISPSSSETSLTTMEPSPSQPKPTSNVLFTPSLAPTTPEMLHRQDQYHSISREEHGPPTPDPTKVKRVFPWEERSRHAPGRVFPGEGLPSTVPSHLPVSATPERKATSRSPMPSPLVGFPPSFQPRYPSDSPLPQRHASKVPWPVPSSSPLCLEGELGGVETSSQDGDVEDEVDSEEETVMRSRSRSSSIGIAKRPLKHRSIGVQTDPREVREEGIQVTTYVPVSEVAKKLILMNKRSRRNWSTSTGSTSPPTVTAAHVLNPSLSAPTLDSYHSLLPSNSRIHRASTTLALDEAGDSSSLPAGGPPPSRIRKGARVWDPARGVEAFKRGSEEVLTKFMKIGSWEGRA